MLTSESRRLNPLHEVRMTQCALSVTLFPPQSLSFVSVLLVAWQQEAAQESLQLAGFGFAPVRRRTHTHIFAHSQLKS